MEISESINIILFIITLLSVLFSVFFYFRNPQEKLEKNQAINEEKDKNKATILSQKEVENKALLLAEQVRWDKENNEKKFAELGCRITESMTLAQNHIHTVDTKVDALLKTVGLMSNEITRLSTIIEERMPKCK